MPTTTRSFGLPPLVMLVLAVLVASLMLTVVLARPAQAATLTVTTTADELNNDGDCSLREAIEAANTNAAVDGCAAGSNTVPDTIVFDVGQEATITLSSGLSHLLIMDDAGLTINGQLNEITISGTDAVNDSGGVFRVEPGALFNLSNLTVADGNSSTFAGALLNNGGEVEVRNTTISGSSATDNGGGIVNLGGGELTVTNSTISGNSAGGVGGGIVNAGGTLTVTISTISGNNAAGANGGSGIYNEGTGEVINSTISGNGTGGGDEGGGIANGTNGTLTVSKSTISGNSVTGNGGGISNAGGTTLTVTNSTISGNSAGGVGGGIVNFGTLTVTNSTFSGNSATEGGGGIFVEFSTATLKNTIVANSAQDSNCTEGFDATIADGGYNMEDADTCGFSASNNSQPSTEPRLDALADNGGPTQTHALKPASPAINAIPSATNGCATTVTTDQRGIKRPQGGKCEIGSFEDSSPRVTSVVPIQDATGIAPGANVSAFFSEAMRANTINANSVKLFKAGATTPINAQVSYNAVTKRAILNPNTNLQRGTRYKAVVTTGVRDLPGNRLDQDQNPSNGNQQKVWFFTIRN